MRQTSLLAYRSLDKDTLSRSRAKVYEALQEIGPACNKEIALHLGWEINRVTPRMLELRQNNKVVEAYKDLYNGRTVCFWDCKDRKEYESNDND